MLCRCLRAQSSSKPHFLSSFVHNHSYPHTFLSTALDKICAIYNMTWVGSAIGWERPLLSCPYASGKSLCFQPPLGRHSYHVLRPCPTPFVLIPVSRLKLEHCSFPVPSLDSLPFSPLLLFKDTPFTKRCPFIMSYTRGKDDDQLC